MLQDYIRRRNLFSSPVMNPSISLDLNKMDLNSRTSQVDDEEEQQGSNHGIADIYSKLANTEPGPAQKQYRDFLETTPNREDYKPNKMARVASILAGISEGAKGDTEGAINAPRAILDRGYNTALGDYKFKGDRLKGAADLEEKDISNRVKTYRDIIQDQNAQEQLKRQNRLADAQIANYKSLDEDRKSQRLTRGYSYYTDPSTGKRVAVKPNSSGQFDKFELGAGALTPDQQIDLTGKKAGAASNARFVNDKKLAEIRGDQARNTQNAKFKNIQELLKFKAGQPSMTIEHLSDGSIVLIDKNNNSVQDTGFNSGKLGDTKKAALGLKNAKELKETPGPDKTTTTTVSDDGKSKITSTTSRAGKVKMIDLNGKAFMVDPKEVDEAINHGWKRAK